MKINQKSISYTDLDKIDRKIIILLQENGRRTNADIARFISMSEATVKNRINRLIKSGTLKILAVLNPQVLGYLTDITVLIQVQPGQLEKVGKKLLTLNEVVYLSYVTGNVDIIIEVLLQKPDELFEFISKTLGGISEIRSTESDYIMRTDKINYEWKLPENLSSAVISGIQPVINRKPQSKKRKGIKKDYRIKRIEIDKVDQQIIRLLQENCCRTNVDIAHSINMNESTIKNRIDHLIKQRLLMILAILNPQSVGYFVDVLVGIRVQRGQLEKVGEILLALNEVVYLSYHSGRFDILIEVLLQNSEEFFRFISKTLEGITGIKSAEKFYILHNEKINYEWKLPINYF